jgi:YjbE family integral membrane protein
MGVVEGLSAVLGIVIIDLVLSGDNAVVIGMAAHRLPARQRRLAILIGGGAAIVLRISLTAVATLLLTLPLLRAVGGVLLLWIAWKLLKEEEESAEGVQVASSMREAIMTILAADFIMSLDNVLGVAAAAHGDVGLLMFGLVLSMAILMIGGGITANLINRFWWLAYIGAGVIAWVGAEMLFADPYVEQVLHLSTAAHLLVITVATAATLALAHIFHRHLPSRRRAAEKML